MSTNGVLATDDLARDNAIPGTIDPLDLPLPGVGPVLAVKRFYRNYAKFSGRASRSEYWWVAFVFTFAFSVLGNAAHAAGTASGYTDWTGTFQPGSARGPFIAAVVLLAAATVIPMIALGIRRLHDTNTSGLLYLVALVPAIGSLVLLVFFALPSKPEGSRFDTLRPVYPVTGQPELFAPHEIYPHSAYPMQQQAGPFGMPPSPPGV